jgi:hypothetical protein
MNEAGLIMISLACCLYGVVYAVSERKRITIICEVERLIGYMLHRIEYYRQSIYDIYISFESDVLDECGFSAALSNGWEKAIDTLKCPKALKNDLYSLGIGLGMKDSVAQIEGCRRCLSALEEYTYKEKQEIASRVKIYIWLGITVGAVILIMGI